MWNDCRLPLCVLMTPESGRKAAYRKKETLRTLRRRRVSAVLRSHLCCCCCPHSAAAAGGKIIWQRPADSHFLRSCCMQTNSEDNSCHCVASPPAVNMQLVSIAASTTSAHRVKSQQTVQEPKIFSLSSCMTRKSMKSSHFKYVLLEKWLQQLIDYQSS